MNCSRLSEPERLAELAHLARALAGGAALELYLTPKPGLVDLADRGAHRDLSLPLMERSLGIVAAYLDDLARSLAAGEAFARQREIGIAAERRMFGELGTNTHKGYVFLSGMLLIARRHAPAAGEQALRRTLAALASDFFAGGEITSDGRASHGRAARDRYGAGGIVHEAIRGCPALFEEALPAFRRTLAQRNCFRAASFAMLARLMQTVDDTTTLHRGGAAGLARLRRDGRQLERLIAAGDDPLAFLRATNRTYIRRNLTMGGVADLLALAYGVLLAGGEIAEHTLDDLSAGRFAASDATAAQRASGLRTGLAVPGSP